MYVVVAVLLAPVVPGDPPWPPLLLQLVTLVPVVTAFVVIAAVPGHNLVEPRELPPGMRLQPGELGPVLDTVALLLLVVPLLPELREPVFEAL